jgi:hypothetical protein
LFHSRGRAALRGSLEGTTSLVCAVSLIALLVLALRPWLLFVAPLRSGLVSTLLAVAALGFGGGALGGLLAPGARGAPSATAFSLLASTAAAELAAGGWSGGSPSPPRYVTVGLIAAASLSGCVVPLALVRLIKLSIPRGRALPIVPPAALGALLLGAAVIGSPGRPHRVVLFGIDALDLDFLQEMMRRTPLPNFERLLTEGASGGLLSEPPFSPPSWSTLATGKLPTSHGVDNWTRNDRERGRPRLLDRSSLKAATVFEIAEAHGMPAFFVDWPVLGRQLADVDTEVGRTAIVLFTFGERLPVLLRRIASIGQDPQMRLPLRARDGDIGVSAIARYLWGRPETRLLGVAITTTDALQHLYWHSLRPAEFGMDPDVASGQAEKVLDVYRFLDRMIEPYLDDPKTDLLCFSDHGSEPIPRGVPLHYRFAGNMTFDLDAVLRAWGFTEPMPDGTVDLARSRLYDGSGLLFDRVCVNVTDARVRATGKSRDQLAQAGRHDVEDAARRFATLRFEDDQTPVFPGEYATPWNGAPVAERPVSMVPSEPPLPFPDYDTCELVLGQGFETTLDAAGLRERIITDGAHRWRAGDLLTSRGWTGTHRTLGLLAARGPSFARGAQVRAGRGADLTPTVLHLLGLPVGADMAGRVLTEIFAPDRLPGQRAIATVDSYEGRVRRAMGADDAPGRKAVEERLRALGYIK